MKKKKSSVSPNETKDILPCCQTEKLGRGTLLNDDPGGQEAKDYIHAKKGGAAGQ
jgi:hypothetical protein